MKIIGLTGGIGSGKSTVAAFLAELGAQVIDADKIGHEVYAPGTRGWQQIVNAFGKDVLTADNKIDRAKLGKIVFTDPESMARLNKIMYPRITGLLKEKLAAMKKQAVKAAVVDATLLIESGFRPLVDEVWVTVAGQDTVIQRLKNRNGYSETESLGRIHAQRTHAERVKDADVIIDTNCSLDEVRAKVRELWQKRIIVP